MKQKWPLFSGIILLVTGIVLKFIELLPLTYIPFFVVGGSLKIFYIYQIIRKGRYKPGIEIIFLIIGLVLFFTGLMLKYNYVDQSYIYWTISGLTLKLAFVILFILKIRKPAK